MGINQFSDLTQEEFVNIYLGETVPYAPYNIQEPTNAGFEGEVDWRK